MDGFPLIIYVINLLSEKLSELSIRDKFFMITGRVLYLNGLNNLS